MSQDARARLTARLLQLEDQQTALHRQHAQVVAASQGSNADDEHDPEGATIAFERQQVVALLRATERGRQDVVRALAALDDGTYGTCATCGGLIAAARLEARPGSRTCIACAATAAPG